MSKKHVGKHGDDAACLKNHVRGTEPPSRRGRCRSLASSWDDWCNILRLCVVRDSE